MPKAPKFYDVRLLVGMRKGYHGRYLPKSRIQNVVVTDTGLGFTITPAEFDELQKGKLYKEKSLIFDRLISDRKELAQIQRALPLIKQQLSQESILEEIIPARARFA